MACVLRGSLAYRGPMTAGRGDHVNSQVSCLICILSRTLCYIRGVRTVRALASRVALLWIVWQASTLAATPVVIALSASGNAVAEQLCECPDAVPGRQCPMHHHSNTGHQTGSSDVARCSMRAPVTPAALAAIAIVTGTLPVQIASWVDPEFTSVVAIAADGVFSRSTPPLSPPPKA